MPVHQSKRKFLFICEGECTEPDYFKGIIRNQKELGIEHLVSLDVIPKLNLDRNETDIETLIEIARDYVQYCRSNGNLLSRRLAVTLLFENACSLLKESNKFIRIETDNRKLLKIRSTIDDELDSNGISKGILSQEEISVVSDICTLKFSELFGLKLTEVKPNPLRCEPIFDGDVICIVHDRDYHETYFPHEKYMSACKTIAKLSKEPVEYRLVITYPKFEFWLLLHAPYFDVKKPDIRKLKDYSKRPGPSDYVDKLLRNEGFIFWKDKSKKRIDEEDFDMRVCPNIQSAIEKSEYPDFKRDLLELCDNPGTLMGILMKDILSER